MKTRELENKRGFDVEWRTGPRQDYAGILPSTSNRQEEEIEQEGGTEMKKINIGEGNDDKRKT